MPLCFKGLKDTKILIQTSEVLQASVEAGIVFFALIQSSLLITDGLSKNRSSVLDQQPNHVNVAARCCTVQRSPK